MMSTTSEYFDQIKVNEIQYFVKLIKTILSKIIPKLTKIVYILKPHNKRATTISSLVNKFTFKKITKETIINIFFRKPTK